MKKTYLLFTMIAAGSLMTSCGGGAATEAETATATEETTEMPEVTEAANWMVSAQESAIMWEGGTSGAMVYTHTGNVDVSGGEFTTEGDAIVEGAFTIDMTSIVPVDEGFSEEHPVADLAGHLTTPDFFNTEVFPTANFAVKSVNGNSITGDLTIRDKTNEETIEVSSINVEGDRLTAEGALVFDRQKYDVKWVHYMKDVLLADNITLKIKLVAKKKG